MAIIPELCFLVIRPPDLELSFLELSAINRRKQNFGHGEFCQRENIDRCQDHLLCTIGNDRVVGSAAKVQSHHWCSIINWCSENGRQNFLVGAKLKKEQSYADLMAVVNQIFPRPSRVTQTPKHCSKNWWKKDLIPHHLLMFLLLNIQVEPLSQVRWLWPQRERDPPNASRPRVRRCGISYEWLITADLAYLLRRACIFAMILN